MDIELVKTMIDIGLYDLLKYKISESVDSTDTDNGIKVKIHLTEHFLTVLKSNIRQTRNIDNSIILSIMAYAPQASEQEWSAMYSIIVNCLGLINPNETITPEEDENLDRMFKQSIKDRESV